jgi:hypothetical protein
MEVVLKFIMFDSLYEQINIDYIISEWWTSSQQPCKVILGKLIYIINHFGFLKMVSLHSYEYIEITITLVTFNVMCSDIVLSSPL